MIGSRRVAVNDGVVIVDVVHGDGFFAFDTIHVLT
jgi:hypothetical protein